MSLFFAELRKVWGGRVFPALLAILAAANLLLLWMGTRPTAKQPPASAYRAVGAELSDKTMEEKGTYLHDKYTEIESLVKIGQYYREQAYGGYGLTQYRQDNAAMFDAYSTSPLSLSRHWSSVQQEYLSIIWDSLFAKNLLIGRPKTMETHTVLQGITQDICR